MDLQANDCKYNSDPNLLIVLTEEIILTKLLFGFYWWHFMCIALGMRRGMERMQQAFEIYPYCASALNYLANHFFFTGQHFLVEQLTETALAVSTHGPTKSHSFYNLARSYHSKVWHLFYHIAYLVLKISLARNFVVYLVYVRVKKLWTCQC